MRRALRAAHRDGDGRERSAIPARSIRSRRACCRSSSARRRGSRSFSPLPRKNTTRHRAGRQRPRRSTAAARLSRATDARTVAELTPAMIEEAVAEFRGTYLQQPPVFSAKKIDGDRAYDLARRNEPRAAAGRRGHGDRARGPRVARHHRCGCAWCARPGYYVRSLADAIGERLGTGGASRGARADAQRRLHPGRCRRARRARPAARRRRRRGLSRSRRCCRRCRPLR